MPSGAPRRSDPSLPDERPSAARLTPSLAEQYANKQQKTVTRDLNVLQDLGLIERAETGRISTRIETMAAFLPLRRLEP